MQSRPDTGTVPAMTWGEIGRALWAKVWPGVAALMVLATWGVASWLLGVSASKVLLSRNAMIIAGLTVAGAIIASRRRVPVRAKALPPSEPVARDTDSRDPFEVGPGDPSVELVGGPFDGRRAVPIVPPRLIWVGVSESGIPDAFTASRLPDMREGARLLGYYAPEIDGGELTRYAHWQSDTGD